MNSAERSEEVAAPDIARRFARRRAFSLLQLFNLATALFGKEGPPETVVPKIGQEIFMDRFTKLGFIPYNDGMQVKDHF